MKGLDCAVLVIQLEVFVVLIQVLLRSGTISTSNFKLKYVLLLVCIVQQQVVQPQIQVPSQY